MKLIIFVWKKLLKRYSLLSLPNDRVCFFLFLDIVIFMIIFVWKKLLERYSLPWLPNDRVSSYS